jgi:hypothetical protein
MIARERSGALAQRRCIVRLRALLPASPASMPRSLLRDAYRGRRECALPAKHPAASSSGISSPHWLALSVNYGKKTGRWDAIAWHGTGVAPRMACQQQRQALAKSQA